MNLHNCLKCGKSFSFQYLLKRHMQLKHVSKEKCLAFTLDTANSKAPSAANDQAMDSDDSQ